MFSCGTINIGGIPCTFVRELLECQRNASIRFPFIGMGFNIRNGMDCGRSISGTCSTTSNTYNSYSVRLLVAVILPSEFWFQIFQRDLN